jgi:hypothetical protein
MDYLSAQYLFPYKSNNGYYCIKILQLAINDVWPFRHNLFEFFYTRPEVYQIRTNDHAAFINLLELELKKPNRWTLHTNQTHSGYVTFFDEEDNKCEAKFMIVPVRTNDGLFVEIYSISAFLKGIIGVDNIKKILAPGFLLQKQQVENEEVATVMINALLTNKHYHNWLEHSGINVFVDFFDEEKTENQLVVSVADYPEYDIHKGSADEIEIDEDDNDYAFHLLSDAKLVASLGRLPNLIDSYNDLINKK